MNILIVDDEVLIVESLKSKLQRIAEGHEFKIYGTTDPLEAIEMFDKFNPQIAFIDIKMPKLNGIELIEELSKKSDRCKFVILSCYDDFEYVRGAFKKGAYDYLVKPISLNDLKNIVNGIIYQNKSSINNTLKEENGKVKKVEIKNILFSSEKDSNYHIIDHANVNKIVLEELNLRYFAVLLFGFKDNEYIYRIKQLDEIIHFILSKHAFSELKYGITFYNAHILILFINTNYTDIGKNLRDIAENIQKNIHLKMNIDCYVSVTNVEENKSDLIELVDRAKILLCCRMKQPVQKIYTLEENFNELKLDPDRVKSIGKRIELYSTTENIEMLVRTIDEVFSIEKNNLSCKELNEIYGILIRTIQNIGSYYGFAFSDCEFEEFVNFVSLEEARSYLKNLYYEMSKKIQNKMKCSKKIIELAIEYVKKKIFSEISLAEVANHLNVSYSYLSRIFREELGVSFTEYVKNLKMECAKELLNDPTCKIQDIAEKIGYESVYHFSRAFKNFFGISPNCYRKIMFRANENSSNKHL